MNDRPDPSTADRSWRPSPDAFAPSDASLEPETGFKPDDSAAGDNASDSCSGDVRHDAHRPGVLARLWAVPVFAWKYLVGAILCMSPLGSIIVLGWVQRWTQRTVLKRWHRRSGSPLTWRAFIHSDPAPAIPATSTPATSDSATQAASGPGASAPVNGDAAGPDPVGPDPLIVRHRHAPNWLLAQNAGRTIRRGSWGQRLALPVRSLGANLKQGFAAAFNIFVLTLPGCALWAWAWWAGWNNSFHKGYEQAGVGPIAGLAGIVLFIVAMVYLPLGLARQAAAGSWRAFYDFRVVRRVIAVRWIACVGLAGLYALLAVPVNLMKTAPLAFDRIEGYAQLTDAELLSNLNGYFFLACLAVFPMYLLLKVAGARIYAGGLLAALQRGRITPDLLDDAERNTLHRLELLPVEPLPQRSLPARTARGSGRLLIATVAVSLLAAVWFAFVAQIFISEFLNYHGPRGWLNQPLVQLPWFRYLPPHLTGG